MTTVGEGTPHVPTVEEAITALELRLAEREADIANLEGVIAAQASRIGALEDECNRLRNGGATSIGADMANRSGRKHFGRR